MNCSLYGEGHIAIQADLSLDSDIKKLVNDTPIINGFVSNAGVSLTMPIQYINIDSLCSLFNINTFAPIILFQQLLKQKKLQLGSSVVFTSSMAGVGPVTLGNSTYSASKGALSAFVRSAALELAGRRIRVNAICPGMVETSMITQNQMISKSQYDEDKKNYPLGRYGRPEDVAYAIIYLLSDASSWMTGNNILLDGGYSLR